MFDPGGSRGIRAVHAPHHDLGSSNPLENAWVQQAVPGGRVRRPIRSVRASAWDVGACVRQKPRTARERVSRPDMGDPRSSRPEASRARAAGPQRSAQAPDLERGIRPESHITA